MPRPRTPLSIESASAGMITHRVVVPAHEVVFVKGVLEASEGVAAVFAESGGELAIVTHESREPALQEILADLAEVGLAETSRAPSALSGA